MGVFLVWMLLDTLFLWWGCFWLGCRFQVCQFKFRLPSWTNIVYRGSDHLWKTLIDQNIMDLRRGGPKGSRGVGFRLQRTMACLFKNSRNNPALSSVIFWLIEPRQILTCVLGGVLSHVPAKGVQKMDGAIFGLYFLTLKPMEPLQVRHPNYWWKEIRYGESMGKNI